MVYFYGGIKGWLKDIYGPPKSFFFTIMGEKWYPFITACVRIPQPKSPMPQNERNLCGRWVEKEEEEERMRYLRTSVQSWP